jgi:hypothetical protein
MRQHEVFQPRKKLTTFAIFPFSICHRHQSALKSQISNRQPQTLLLSCSHAGGTNKPRRQSRKTPTLAPFLSSLELYELRHNRANIKSSHPIDQYLRNYQASHVKRTTSNDLILSPPHFGPNILLGT